MKIALATCKDKPDLNAGDQLLATELEKLGAEVEVFVWSETALWKKPLQAVVIRSVWDYHKHLPEFKAWLKGLEKKNIQIFNGTDVVNWNIDKSYLLKLQSQGHDVVPSLLIQKNDQAAEVLKNLDSSWENLVIKPTVSATAYLTFLSDKNDPRLLEHIIKVQEHSDVLVQPFIDSVKSDGEVSLIFFKNEKVQFSHAILKTPSNGDYRVQSDFGGKVTVFEPNTDLINLAMQSLIPIPNSWVYARVDLVNWREPYPLIGEIELIEPDLFLEHRSHAAKELAQIVLQLATRTTKS